MGSTFDTAGAIAAEQHGRVTRAQLLAAGVTPARIARWLADGRLRRVHTGVYAVGHVARSLRADYMAAVIACQPPAAGLSGWAAGHLLRIHVRPRPPRPEVTVATTAGRRRPGIIVHRARELHPLDLWIMDRIPVTSPERTLLDLAPQLSAPALARACHEAWVHYKTTPDHVAACMRRNPHRPGAAKLWLALGGDVTLSKLEDGFLALLRRHGVPIPRTNIDHAGDKVDCHWAQIGLTVELLSFRFHGSRHAFEADVARRRRSNHVAFTWGDVFERGPQTVAELAQVAGWSDACRKMSG
ncbi:MAG: hypothetical protein QOE31_359 [Solirubrobacteraceae bacterium]|nr:hypothetical protein [Solirubrobacteraceae bacterium]